MVAKPVLSIPTRRNQRQNHETKRMGQIASTYNPILISLLKRKNCNVRSRFEIVHLVTPNNMDNEKEIGQGNKPNRLLKRDEDIVVDIVAKNLTPNEGNREIAQGNHNVGNYTPFPHWFFGGFFWG